MSITYFLDCMRLACMCFHQLFATIDLGSPCSTVDSPHHVPVPVFPGGQRRAGPEEEQDQLLAVRTAYGHRKQSKLVANLSQGCFDVKICEARNWRCATQLGDKGDRSECWDARRLRNTKSSAVERTAMFDQANKAMFHSVSLSPNMLGLLREECFARIQSATSSER